MTRQEKIEYIAALRERLIREARTDLCRLPVLLCLLSTLLNFMYDITTF